MSLLNNSHLITACELPNEQARGDSGKENLPYRTLRKKPLNGAHPLPVIDSGMLNIKKLKNTIIGPTEW